MPGSAPSSTCPLQSLSFPSHVSAVGPVAPWHTGAPATHASAPVLQRPTELPQVEPSAGTLLSSVCALQLSSMPLQSSVLGSLPPWHFHAPVTHASAPS